MSPSSSGSAPRASASGPISHVVWDWNGTLLDDLWLSVAIVNQMLSARALPEVDADRYRDLFDFPVRSFYERVGFDFGAEPFDEIAREYCGTYALRSPECALFPDALPALGALSEAGVAQSVLSSTEEGALHAELSRLDLLDRFERVVGQDTHHAHGKVESGRRLVCDLGVDARRVLLIGDTLHDREVAEAIGVRCLLVSRGHHSRARLEAAETFVAPALQPALAALGFGGRGASTTRAAGPSPRREGESGRTS